MPTRTMRVRCGRCMLRLGLAGRAGPVARPLVRHSQSTGLSVFGLGLSNCLRTARRTEGVHGARRRAARRRVHPGAVCWRAGFQPSRRRALRCPRAPAARATVPLHHAPGAGQKNACRSTVPGRSCSGSRPHGATTPRTSSCRQPARISWARLLKRVFQIDLEHCPNCGGQLKIIAAILEAPVIERIPTHLGLQARAPPRAPARGDFRHAA